MVERSDTSLRTAEGSGFVSTPAILQCELTCHTVSAYSCLREKESCKRYGCRRFYR